MTTIDPAFLATRVVKPRTVLLKEGQTADELFFIEEGLIRVWFNNDGKELTLQFFFDGDTVTSLESFLQQTPSEITIEAIDKCRVSSLKRKDFQTLLENDQNFKDWFYQSAVKKLIVHTNRLLSLLKNKPFDRYQQLVDYYPQILEKVPQHYIASYIGVTAVSLSRIRKRKK